MEWIRMHPYTAAIAGGIFLILLGTFIIQGRSAVSPNTGSTLTWGGSGSGFFLPLGASTPTEEENRTGLYQAVQGSAPFSYIPPAGSSGPVGTQSAAFDLDEFVALLTNSTTQTNTSINTELDYSQLLESYSFIPRGLIATTTLLFRDLTPSQQALLSYGNDAGLYVQSFESLNRNMARVLKNQFEDPQNPQKNQALLDLASDMTEVGSSLAELEVPAQAASANARLAQSYQDMGARLSEIPQAQTETSLIEAMLAYNEAVDAFLESYVALVTLFSVAEVTFDQHESGSIFMFSGSAGF